MSSVVRPLCHNFLSLLRSGYQVQNLVLQTSFTWLRNFICEESLSIIRFRRKYFMTSRASHPENSITRSSFDKALLATSRTWMNKWSGLCQRTFRQREKTIKIWSEYFPLCNEFLWGKSFGRKCLPVGNFKVSKALHGVVGKCYFRKYPWESLLPT